MLDTVETPASILAFAGVPIIVPNNLRMLSIVGGLVVLTDFDAKLLQIDIKLDFAFFSLVISVLISLIFYIFWSCVNTVPRAVLICVST